MSLAPYAATYCGDVAVQPTYRSSVPRYAASTCAGSRPSAVARCTATEAARQASSCGCPRARSEARDSAASGSMSRSAGGGAGTGADYAPVPPHRRTRSGPEVVGGRAGVLPHLGHLAVDQPVQMHLPVVQLALTARAA